MSDTESTPTVFANKVIKQFVQHILGEDMVIEPEDYLVLRMVYRWCGGSWDSLAEGDILMNSLLEKLVGAWGQMDERAHESDTVI